MSDDPTTFAVHETGHMIVAFHYGVPEVRIIKTPDDPRGEGAFHCDFDLLSDSELRVIGVAGAVAELLVFSGSDGGWHPCDIMTLMSDADIRCVGNCSNDEFLAAVEKAARILTLNRQTLLSQARAVDRHFDTVSEPLRCVYAGTDATTSAICKTRANASSVQKPCQLTGGKVKVICCRGNRTWNRNRDGAALFESRQ